MGGRAACFYDETGAFCGTWTKYKVDLEGGEVMCVCIKTNPFHSFAFFVSFISLYEQTGLF